MTAALVVAVLWALVIVFIVGAIHVGQQGTLKRHPCEHANADECVDDGCPGWVLR
jgi:hypothetical protein